MKISLKSLDLDLYYEKLDNELEIYVVPMDKNDIYVTFSTKYGSNNIEFVAQNSKMSKFPLGIAHFLEHKMFEQSDGTDPFAFYSERGCDANANTTNIKTTYLFSGPSFIEDNLNYLINYVQEPYFTDENVEKEKGIIIQEIKMYQDDPTSVLYETLLKNMFVNHPMKNPVIGTIKDVKSITKDDLFKCYNTFYNPSNMFIVVTGNVNPQEVIDIIKNNQDKKEFKSIKIKNKKYNEPDNVKKECENIKFNVSIPKCAVGFKTKINNDLYKQLLYLLILFDSKYGSTSNLYKELIDEKIINTNLFLDIENTEDHVALIVAGISYKPELLLDKIINCKYKVTEKEFNRKKKTLLSSLIFMSDNIYSLNNSIMNDIVKYGKVNYNRYNIIKSLNYEEFNTYIDLDFTNYSKIIIADK